MLEDEEVPLPDLPGAGDDGLGLAVTRRKLKKAASITVKRMMIIDYYKMI